TPDEEEKVGFTGMLRERAAKVGLYYLGRWQVSRGYFLLYTNKKVEKPADFKGQKIAAAGWVSNALIPLGITPVSIPVSDYYTAAQTGTIDGLIRSPGGAVEFKLWEVLKYAVDHAISSAAGVAVMNMNTWNGLSPEFQKVITDSQRELLVASEQYQIKIFGEARQKAVDSGMTPIKLSGADAGWFVNSFTTGAWEYFGKTYPDLVTQYQKLLAP
ncbi:MAG: TRAP transporter substrate-binding protein DctP, partial [Chloroflexota bacterium]|nr:TRAP transporter substrate-binding protein DctP [Chloroflexota bacterium]